MRILLTGAAPWCNGSYGKPMRYIVPRLVGAGHEVAIAVFYGFMGGVADTMVGGAPCRLYPTVRDVRMNDIIELHAADFEADVVVSFQDVWVCERWGFPRNFMWMPWMPIDTSPVAPGIRKALEGVFVPMCYSKFGTQELVDAGWPTARYVPLGVDLDVYKPMPQSLARQSLSLPEKGFVAGMVAANASLPPRKAFPEVLLAWKAYLEAGGDGLLYIQTTLTPTRAEGFDFHTALQQLGISWATMDDPDPERYAKAQVLFPNQYRMWTHSIEDEELARVYNAFDVLLAPSHAEGFGLPVLEAQACGKPVVTLNVTSMPEITFAGQCLEPVQGLWEPQGAWRGLPGVADIHKAIIWARDMAEGEKSRTYLAEKARMGAEGFSWDTAINDYLLPCLEELPRD